MVLKWQISILGKSDKRECYHDISIYHRILTHGIKFVKFSHFDVYLPFLDFLYFIKVEFVVSESYRKLKNWKIEKSLIVQYGNFSASLLFEQFGQTHELPIWWISTLELSILKVLWQTTRNWPSCIVLKYAKFGKSTNFSVFKHFWYFLTNFKFSLWLHFFVFSFETSAYFNLNYFLNILSSIWFLVSRESQTTIQCYRNFEKNFIKKTTKFNRNFLKEGKRYLTFPVDFLKAETIFFHKSCNHFWPIPFLIGVKSL